MPTGREQRREEERGERVAAFLEAGRAELRAKGYDRLTLNGVATRARLSKSLIYFYFRNKEDLAFALANDAKRQLLEAFQRARQGQPHGRAQLEAIGRAYAAFTEEAPEAWEILGVMESALPIGGQHQSPSQQAAAALGEAVHREVVEAIQTGQADGSLAADGPRAESAAILLWAFHYGYQRLVKSRNEAVEPFVGAKLSDLLELAITMTTAGLLPSEPS